MDCGDCCYAIVEGLHVKCINPDWCEYQDGCVKENIDNTGSKGGGCGYRVSISKDEGGETMSEESELQKKASRYAGRNDGKYKQRGYTAYAMLRSGYYSGYMARKREEKEAKQ